MPRLTILQTNPWDLTLVRWYIYLGLYTHKVGCPADKYYACYGDRPILELKELVLIVSIILCLSTLRLNCSRICCRLITSFPMALCDRSITPVYSQWHRVIGLSPRYIPNGTV
jgi:hypothetical protein